LGVVSASTGVGLVVVLGTDILQFLFNNKQNFPKWRAALSAVLRVRKKMKTLAPTLYDKVFDAALIGVWRGSRASLGIGGADAAGNIPDSVANDPKIIGRGIGAIIGKIGKNTMAHRLTVINVIIAILLQLVLAAAKGVPGAVKISIDKRKTAGKDIIAALKKTGVVISERDVQTIMNEIEKNADGVKTLLLDLQRTFRVFQAKDSGKGKANAT